MFEAELLTKTNGIMRRDGDYFTDEFTEEIGKMSGRCIDVGTGAGDVTVDFILPKLNPNSTLLLSDVSEAMVDYAKKTYGNNDRLKFMKLDIETPELPKDLLGQFDHLTAMHCVHWCYDHRRAFENMYSLLRPGGTAFITFLASFRGMSSYADVGISPKYQNYAKNTHRCIPPFQGIERPRPLLKTLLNDVGFHVEICSCRPMTYVWDTVDSLRGLLAAGAPFETDDMPADLKQEFIKDVTKRFMEVELVFNKDRNNKDECSVLGRYNAFAVYVKKPLE